MALSAAMCLGVLFLCVTGPLWWRRRPRGAGRLGAPRGRMPLRPPRCWPSGVAAPGALLGDRFLIRRVPALRRWFDVRA